MATINPGYMGWANLDGVSLRFTDASIAANQEVNAPDLIMGHWDRDAWVAGPITIGGSISGPVTENFAAGTGSVWDLATNRGTDCGSLSPVPLTLYYYCGTDDRSGRTFPEIMIQSLNVSCSAGDIAQFSMEVIGAKEPEWQSYGSKFDDEEKLLTWDKVGVTGGPGGDDFVLSSFDFTINNNIEAVYAIGKQEDGGAMDYYPYALIPGLRHISGTLTYYNIPHDVADAINYDTAHANVGDLAFDLDGTAFTFHVAFHRVVPNSSVGPIMSTVAFTGVGPQSTLDS